MNAISEADRKLIEELEYWVSHGHSDSEMDRICVDAAARIRELLAQPTADASEDVVEKARSLLLAWPTEPTENDNPTCAKCGDTIAVGDGLEWTDGDWCWGCTGQFAELAYRLLAEIANPAPIPAPPATVDAETAIGLLKKLPNFKDMDTEEKQKWWYEMFLRIAAEPLRAAHAEGYAERPAEQADWQKLYESTRKKLDTYEREKERESDR